MARAVFQRDERHAHDRGSFQRKSRAATNCDPHELTTTVRFAFSPTRFPTDLNLGVTTHVNGAAVNVVLNNTQAPAADVVNVLEDRANNTR
jgi:hypothetical protein